MADESQTTSTETVTQPLGNDPAARTTDGTLKGQDTTSTTSTETTKPTEQPSNESTKPNDTAKRAPESYSFKAAEGRELNKEFLDAYTPIFRELDLDQDSAQKLVDTYTKHSDAQVLKMREGWQKEIRDKFGSELDSKLANFGRMKDAVFEGDKESRTAFEKALNLTGAGDHPAIFAAMMKLADKFTEGTHVSGKGPSVEGQKAPGTTTKPSAAQAMWPTLPSSNAA